MTENMNLTKRQLQILKFIAVFIRKNGTPPTLQEIADNAGTSKVSKVTVWEHVNALEDRGALTRRAHYVSRALLLTEAGKDHVGEVLTTERALSVVEAAREFITALNADANTSNVNEFLQSLETKVDEFYALEEQN